MKTISVLEFSEFPGPRNEKIGPNSGQKFRETVLLPAIKEHKGEITIILDGTYGYGSSFLDESFAGLIRDGIDKEIVLQIANNVISNEDPSLKTEIIGWIQEAIDVMESNKK